MVGYIVELMFFVLLSLAALTSLISLHEAATAFLEEEGHIARRWAALWVTIASAIIGALCSLSLGAVDGLSVFGMTLFSLFDFVTAQIFLPIGGFLTCLFIGWFVPKQLVKDEYTNWGTLRGRLFWVYLFLVRFVCPVAIAAIFLHQFGVV
jgi:NSS family neurotransmitter:Na+ symporter